MRPFKRTRHAAADPADDIPTDWRVESADYRRVGQAMGSVSLTLGADDPALSPPAGVRLTVSSPSAALDLDPILVVHEAPGTRHEVRRLWFAMDLSLLIFGDSEFGLTVDDAWIPVPDPVPHPRATPGDDDAAALAAAEVESELRATIASLEERRREAERTADGLKEDGRRLAAALAATLEQVQEERRALLDRVAQTVARLDQERAQRDAAPPHPEPAEPPATADEPAAPLAQDFIARLGAAQGAAQQPDQV